MRKKLDAKKYTVTYEIKTEVTEGSTSPHARRYYSWLVGSFLAAERTIGMTLWVSAGRATVPAFEHAS